MSFDIRENAKIGEKICHISHKSGLEVYFIPKKHSASYAAIATKFGAIDREFTDSDGTRIVLPDGIAHFLEHKMFENGDGKDAFEEYAAHGGDANAYTSEDKTVYLFSSTRDFYDNLRILLKLVTHPYFTAATVSKEQGIIGQEIKMYDDDPSWRLFFNTMDCLYVNNPVKLNVAGSVESIAEITPELLYKIHTLFYNLRNMVLCVAGDADCDGILRVLDEELPDAPAFTAKSVMPDEPAEINKPFSSQALEVSMPLYEIAYKIDPAGVASLDRYIALELAMAVIFDSSSEFYNDNYAKGLFNSLNANFQTVRDGTAFIEITGAAAEPEKVLEAVKAEIEARLTSGFGDKEFDDAKKTLYSDAVCVFDSTDRIANTFINYYFEGGDLLAYPDAVASVGKAYAEECFRTLVKNSRVCLSVITPVNKKEDDK